MLCSSALGVDIYRWMTVIRNAGEVDSSLARTEYSVVKRRQSCSE
jgi:hypothetical protein